MIFDIGTRRAVGSSLFVPKGVIYTRVSFEFTIRHRFLEHARILDFFLALLQGDMRIKHGSCMRSAGRT